MKNRKKIIAVIQARMGSTRLPRKALKKILGKSLVEWIFYRLTFAKELDGIVLSTADSKENNELVKIAEHINLPFVRGSEKDLISRLHKTLERHNADAIVRITGDCPLVDSHIVDLLVSVYRNNPEKGLVTNIFPPTFPDGMDVEVIPAKTLKRLNQEVRDPLYREWLTTTIMEHPDTFTIENVSYKRNVSSVRLTVDYQEDLDLIKEIIKQLHNEGSIFHLEDILLLLEREPALLDINKKWIDTTLINNSRLKTFYNLKSNTH